MGGKEAARTVLSGFHGRLGRAQERLRPSRERATEKIKNRIKGRVHRTPAHRKPKRKKTSHAATNRRMAKVRAAKKKKHHR